MIGKLDINRFKDSNPSPHILIHPHSLQPTLTSTFPVRTRLG